MSGVTTLVLVGAVMLAVLGGVTLLAHIYSLNNIKSRTVGDGQHGTARWASKTEIKRTYKHIPFTPERWREQAKRGEKPTTLDGAELPQGIVVGCTGNITAMVDTGDVHALMIGAAGVGKAAYWLYPCIEYACASEMSWLSTDTKGDIMRNYGQNAYFYDAAEGLLTATILLVAEFCKPEQRHIVSVFKIIQELLAPSGKKGKNQFQQLYREILAVADENGGKLKNRCVFFCDEYGTLPKIESAEMMFSASRSRRLQIVPIIQSFSQLEKNYGKEGLRLLWITHS